MNLYSIFKHPLDAPNHYVVRRFEASQGQTIPREAKYAKTLEEARKLVPQGLVMIVRSPDDPPFLLETWL